MTDEPKLELIQPAHWNVHRRIRDGRERVTQFGSCATLTYSGFKFHSKQPSSRDEANAINVAVEELTGVEIATIQPTT